MKRDAEAGRQRILVQSNKPEPWELASEGFEGMKIDNSPGRPYFLLIRDRSANDRAVLTTRQVKTATASPDTGPPCPDEEGESESGTTK